MSKSNIEWTDKTWNPLVGCKMVSPGCAHCYAETMSKRLAAMAGKDRADGKKPDRKSHYLDVMTPAGKWNGKVSLVPEALVDPFKWKKPCRVFVNSMSDLFHEDVPFEYVDQVWDVMRKTPRHTYQILTKRPERMAAYFEDVIRTARAECGVGVQYIPLPNVWLGTSVEDQPRADERIPHLLRCPAAVRFFSCEPLLGDLGVFGQCPYHALVNEGDSPVDCGSCDGFGRSPLLAGTLGIDWVIVGGESGRGARSCKVEWIRSIVQQCKAAGVPVFVKQLGAMPEICAVDGFANFADLKDSKGGDPSEWPIDLRVREFPGA